MRINGLLGLAVVALVLAASSVARAQEPGTVYGLLTTVDGRGPVAGAVVRLRETRTDKVVTVETDAKGRFSKVGVRPGRYRATIAREGYAEVDVVDIEVRSSDRVRLYVELTPFDEAPFRRQTIRYRRPMVNVEDAALGTRVL